MLAILCVEAHRAGAWVVGEDLGTVEDYVRAELSNRGVLSYRVLQFERGPTNELPSNALAAIGTHDLPTLAGLWKGSDLAAEQALGRQPNVASIEGVVRSLADRAGVPTDSPLDRVTMELHRELAESPCVTVTATFEDALGIEERPNMPGTIDEWPNWRLALPLPLEDVLAQDGVHTVASILSGRKPQSG